jgi:hypothetical protein
VFPSLALRLTGMRITGSRWSILVLGLLLLGCERQANLPPSAAMPAPQARPLLKSNLVITCAHVMIESDLISGVLTARNSGKEPLAVVQRWNSWGAYQWRLTFGAQLAGNPQQDWAKNFYSEEVLAPGEIRHCQFHITRSPDRARIGEEEWWFLVDAPASLSAAAPLPPFVRGQAVTLVMDGTQTGAPVSAPPSPPLCGSVLRRFARRS